MGLYADKLLRWTRTFDIIIAFLWRSAYKIYPLKKLLDGQFKLYKGGLFWSKLWIVYEKNLNDRTWMINISNN